ncbi:MAG TPA: hypothetical protein VK037_00890 [Pseudogracilibacillus sp.]|nr:hypothetical protein [Pseudogracilibacillus sp.]
MHLSKVYFSILFIVITLVSCTIPDMTDEPIVNELDSYEVIQHHSEVEEGDFLFRLYTDQPEQIEGEFVSLKGEIVYIGDEAEIEISHTDEPISFHIKEKIRGYSIPYFIKEIGVYTILTKDEPYEVSFNRANIAPLEEEDKNEMRFIEEFSEREDFPVGYYEVIGMFDFFITDPEVPEDEAHIEFETKIDFKVTN